MAFCFLSGRWDNNIYFLQAPYFSLKAGDVYNSLLREVRTFKGFKKEVYLSSKVIQTRKIEELRTKLLLKNWKIWHFLFFKLRNNIK